MIPKRTETRLLVTFAIVIAIALVLFGVVLLGAGANHPSAVTR